MPATMHQITLNAALMYSTTGVALPASGTARFRRQHAFVSGGQVVLPGAYDAAYASGAFTSAVYLPVPDDAAEAAAYEVMIGGEQFAISLSQDSPTDLAALIALADVEDVSAVSQLLSLYATLAYVNAQVATLTTALATKLTQAQADALYAAIGHTSVIASAGTLGHIKVGANLSIAGDGTLSATGTASPTWQSLTSYLGAGWVAQGTPFGAPQYAIVGTTVTLRGAITRISGTAAPLTMPLAARPAQRQFVRVGTQTGPGQLSLTSDGVMAITTGGVNPIDFTGASYELSAF